MDPATGQAEVRRSAANGVLAEKLWTRLPRVYPRSMPYFKLDEFIDVIKRYPVIYTRLDKQNKQTYLETWDELETIMRTPKQYLMMKWKGLRDNFRVELKKEHYATADKPYVSKWVHYKKLLFLREQVLASLDQRTDGTDSSDEVGKGPGDDDHSYTVASSAISVKSEEPHDGMELTGDLGFMHQDQDSQPSTIPAPFDGTDQRLKLVDLNRLRNYHSDTQELPLKVQIKRFPDEYPPLAPECPPDHQDDDYHFLMSMHPFLRRLPASSKLKVRLEMQQVLLNEILQQATTEEED